MVLCQPHFLVFFFFVDHLLDESLLVSFLDFFLTLNLVSMISEHEALPDALCAASTGAICAIIAHNFVLPCKCRLDSFVALAELHIADLPCLLSSLVNLLHFVFVLEVSFLLVLLFVLYIFSLLHVDVLESLLGLKHVLADLYVYRSCWSWLDEV